MKEKIKYLTILLKELYEFKPTIFLRMVMHTLVYAALPLLQLLLSAFVIQWLMSGIAIQTFLLRLLLFIAVIGLAQMFQNYFEISTEEDMNQLRSHTRKKIG